MLTVCISCNLLRITIDMYKTHHLVVEYHHKYRKQVKFDAKARIVHQDNKKDLVIPNWWPLNQDLLKHMERLREQDKEDNRLEKYNKTMYLRSLQAHK